MQVQAIGNYYSPKVVSNTQNTANNSKNTAFGNRYDAALDVYEQKKAVERQRKHVEDLDTEERNSMFYPTKRQVENARSELRRAEASLRRKEQEYESYNPSRYDFIDDVDKGRKQREERLSKIDTSWNDGGGTNLWEITGTSPGDWPFYCP